MKNIIIITSFIIISFVGLNGYSNIGLENSRKNVYGYYLIHSGYLGSEVFKNGDGKVVISSKKELEQYISKYDRKTYSDTKTFDGELKRKLDKYGEDFFENKSLVLYYIELSSGSTSVSALEPTVKGDKITINYEVIEPPIGTCDMNGYVYVAEVSKKVKNVTEQVKVNQVDLDVVY